MLSTLLCDRDNSLLTIIDVQPRLAAAMHPGDRERVLRNAGVLAEAATILGVPQLHTEQYPKGLGNTETELASRFPPGAHVVDKTCFSCRASEPYREAAQHLHRQQLVLAGMESHVCVLQTALEMHHDGYQVFVAEDAVCSREPGNHANALARLRQAGVIVSNTESILFEWLRDARHAHFKAISALIK